MSTVNISKTKQYELEPQEVALILDALADKPFKQVYQLIPKLMKAADDRPQYSVQENAS